MGGGLAAYEEAPESDRAEPLEELCACESLKRVKSALLASSFRARAAAVSKLKLEAPESGLALGAGSGAAAELFLPGLEVNVWAVPAV